MRRIIKPFSVETRRTGRKTLTTSPAEEKPSAPVTARPLFKDDENYREALRAADALFGKPLEKTSAAPAESVAAEPARRILQSLTEEDPIHRLLAEEEANRPRRGRAKRKIDDDFTPARPAKPIVAETQPTRTIEPTVLPRRVPGYVRGLIYARYARHDAARPGEQWRKRSVRPLW